MFRPAQHELQEAIEALGWVGMCVGPVRQLGTVVWPVIAMLDVARVGSEGSFRDAPSGHAAALDVTDVELVGCLVVGEASASLVAAASLFAGYAPRAIVVSGQTPLSVVVDAAFLDQGVVVVGASGVEVLSVPGPRVQSRLSMDSARADEFSVFSDAIARRRGRAWHAHAGVLELTEKALTVVQKQTGGAA